MAAAIAPPVFAEHFVPPGKIRGVPGKVTVVSEDLLEACEDYIAHVCPRLVKVEQGKGVAKQIFERYPHANIYAERSSAFEEGHIIVKGEGPPSAPKRGVINMIAQQKPGKPSKKGDDTPANRQKWFSECLKAIGKIPGITSLGLPARVSCGSSGGSSEAYEQMIADFIDKNKHIKVTLYTRKPEIPLDNYVNCGASVM